MSACSGAPSSNDQYAEVRPLYGQAVSVADWDQPREVDVGAVEVPARRQARLDHRDRAVRFGEQDALELDADVPVRPQRVHPHVGVARVDEHLLRLLVPGVQRVPVEPDRAGQPVDRVVGEQPPARGPGGVADPQPDDARRAELHRLDAVLVDEHLRIDVRDRHVELRVERPLPPVARIAGVEHQAAGELGPDAARHRLDPPGPGGRPGVTAAHRSPRSSGGCSSSTVPRR